MKKILLLLLINISFTFVSAAITPVNLQVNLVFSNSAILQWENGTCAQNNFVLAYKDSTLSSWDSIVVVNNIKSLLLECIIPFAHRVYAQKFCNEYLCK